MLWNGRVVAGGTWRRPQVVPNYSGRHETIALPPRAGLWENPVFPVTLHPKISKRPNAGQEILRILRLRGGADGLTSEDLARTTRYSLRTVRDSLLALPARDVQIIETGTHPPRWRAHAPAGGDPTEDVAASVRKPDEQRWARTALQMTGAKWRAEGLALAQMALRDGDFTGARRIIAERALSPGDVAARTPPAARTRLRILAWRLRADLELQAGRGKAAARSAEKAIPLAIDAEPQEAFQLLAIRGAGLRMAGGIHLPESAASFARAYAVAEASGGATLGEARRWIATSWSTTLLIMDDLSTARRMIDLAADNAGAEIAGVAETIMGDARLLRLEQRTEQAAEQVTRVGALAGIPRWARGWLYRHRLDTFWPIDAASVDLPGWAGVFDAAWRTNDGYLFQRKMLLARLASLSPGDQPPLDGDVAHQVAWAVARMHRERHGTVPFECPVCRAFALPGRARHALGIESSADWRYFL